MIQPSKTHPPRGTGFRFLVIADSHIRPPDQEVDAYPSNAWMVERNEFIVELCNRIDASFVVHLGDIVHPLPVEASHAEAISIARGVYDDLRHPIHFVPGNHDVGDKPNALVAVPAVDEANYPVFEEAWGPASKSFDVGGCHFVIVDAQVLNSGFQREADQRTWLERDLAEASAAGHRIFLFTHYPPFVRERHENEHYDNIGEPARTWLLDLCERFSVESVFSGHVHTFLYNRHGSTDLYVAPSTGFVRPDYSEVAAVPPPLENGRDDPPKLGVFIVEVTDDGHAVQPIRSFGSRPAEVRLPVRIPTLVDQTWTSPIGVTLRHGWRQVSDFPTAGLDEFRRKRIRNDAPLLALWEARIADVRVPIADLADPAGVSRLRDLAGRGMRFTAFSGGVPDRSTIELVRSIAPDLHRWEVIAPGDRFEDVVLEISGIEVDGIRIAISPIVPIGAPGSAVHHFVSAGFDVDARDDMERLGEIDGAGLFQEAVFRVAWPAGDGDVLDRARAAAAHVGRRAVVVAELPRAGESSEFTDDDAVGNHVATIASLAEHHPGTSVFLDGFMDHDRGYYPRHGLLDRAFNPRPALYRLIEASAT
ncbi:MAG: metallophosphoesterase [Acidimicrobiia bacterium]|nr:metallophosphoesterase [Acidimicrobiia bacterium]